MLKPPCPNLRITTIFSCVPIFTFFLPRDKTNKMTVRPAKTQISLADLILRWVHMPFCCFCHAAARILINKHPSIFISDIDFKITRQ